MKPITCATCLGYPIMKRNRLWFTVLKDGKTVTGSLARVVKALVEHAERAA